MNIKPITKAFALALHVQQINEFGGLHGVRDVP
jgi:hypothetical protein